MDFEINKFDNNRNNNISENKMYIVLIKNNF